MYNSTVFSISELCNQYHYLIPEYFHHSRKKTCYLSIVTPYSLTHVPAWELLPYFLYLWICLFWIIHRNGIKQYMVQHDWLLSLSVML